jgi:hypothetical protein
MKDVPLPSRLRIIFGLLVMLGFFPFGLENTLKLLQGPLELGSLRQADGEAVLSAPVRQGLELIRNQGLQRYRLSPALLNDVLFYQRIIESALPARFDSEAPALLALASEPRPGKACRALRSGGQVVLWSCP